MKKSLIFLGMLCVFCSATAQTYHPLVATGKVWSNYHDYCKLKEYRFSEFNKFEGDTLIDGYTYKIVWKSQDTTLAFWSIDSYIREDSLKRVYQQYPYGTDEKLIYNFGVLAGDSIFLRDTCDENKYVVDSVTWTTLLDNEPRREYYLHNPYFNLGETWIEGVGCTKGALAGGTCGFCGDLDPELICFFEHDTLKYHNPDFEGCFVITGIPATSDVPGITVFPNPVFDHVTFRFESQLWDDALIEICDLPGKLICSRQVTGNSITINVKDLNLSPGTYLYRAFRHKTLVISGKLSIL
ncbi:MAG: T9SS type A sorting domain-containing protein [Bacteroidetes bacterium]|nr:T9SS type A sorting domain-containing protein [Bacteroidota bacterium]